MKLLINFNEANKNERGTERHLSKTDESIVRPAGFVSSLYVLATLTRRPDDALVSIR